MRIFIILAFCIATISASPRLFNNNVSQRIVGGSYTSITQYPFMAAVLFAYDGVTYVQHCGGSILNNRSVLTAAYCLENRSAYNFRFRIGSSWANSGGTVHNVNYYIIHEDFIDSWCLEADIGILRSTTAITFNNQVRAASIAGINYNVADNSVVHAAGWGAQSFGGPNSELLRQVQIWIVNLNICAQRYSGGITANMLCAGWLDVGGRGHCYGDLGGPLLHDGVVIGVLSLSNGCGLPNFPGVSTRVSSYTTWIQANA